MKRNFGKIAIAAAALLIATLFTACNMGLPWDMELWGDWDDGFGTEKTFTNTTFNFDGEPSDWGEYDYSGDVVLYDNNSFNIASENPADGNFGHMILEITYHKADSSQIDTYTLIRWKNLKTVDGVTTVELSEAYPAGWVTATAAAEEADENHFVYSTHTLIEN